jgi:hypothetical protein
LILTSHGKNQALRVRYARSKVTHWPFMQWNITKTKTSLCHGILYRCLPL